MSRCMFEPHIASGCMQDCMLVSFKDVLPITPLRRHNCSSNTANRAKHAALSADGFTSAMQSNPLHS